MFSKQLGDRTKDRLKMFTAHIIWKTGIQSEVQRKRKQLIASRRKKNIKYQKIHQLTFEVC